MSCECGLRGINGQEGPMNNVGIKNGSYSDRSQTVSQVSAQGKAQSGPVSVLTKGQNVTGEVTDLIGKDVTIALDGGGKLRARLADNTELEIGMRATFDVAEADASKILLKIMTDPGASGKNPVIDKALIAAGLADNPRNREAVEALLDRGMSIDKSSVHRFLAASAPYEGASLSTVADLIGNDIPLNPINVYGYESYKANEAGLRSDLAALSEQIEELVSQFPEEAEAIVAILEGDETAAAQNPDGGTEQAAGAQAGPEGAASFEGETTAASQDAEAQQTGATHDTAGPGQDTGTPDAQTQTVATSGSEATVSGEAGTAKPDVNGTVQNRGAETDASNPAQNSGVSPETGTQSISAVGQQNTDASGAVAGKAAEAAQTDQTVATQGSAETADLAATGNLAQTASEPKTQEASGQRESATAAREGQQGESSQPIIYAKDGLAGLKSLVMNGMTLKPEDLRKKTATEYFEKTARKLMALRDAAQQMGEKGEKLSEAVSKALDDMQFLRDLNMVFSYVQLPVKFSGKSEGEVHVYARKRRLSDADNISVLLHLSMEALGQLDIHMSLHKQELAMTMYTDDDESLRLLKESMDALTEALKEIGLSTTVNFEKREEMTPPVKELLAGSDNPDFKRYSFDIRA